jgi:hypothetical protein
MALQRREVSEGEGGKGGVLVGWAKGEMQRQPYIDKSTVRMDYAKLLVLGGLIPLCGCVCYPPLLTPIRCTLYRLIALP